MGAACFTSNYCTTLRLFRQGLSLMAKEIVLVVDDDENQRWLVKTYMQKHGFEVLLAENGTTMREQITTRMIDIVLLDVSMPGEDGFTLARYLREHHDVGIVMLTASGELIDRILGLEIGADDYITKPFEPRELLARVKAVLRRTAGQKQSSSESDSSDESLYLGHYVIDTDSREITDEEGNVIPVTATEFDLLTIFAENPDKVLTRDVLLDLTNKGTSDPFDRSIDIRIGRIRKKIEDNPSEPTIIQTVRGVGYVYSRVKRAE